MKTKLKIKGLQEQRPESQKKKGVALLTVLTVMSLATILVLAFFTMAQSELESSTSYARGAEAKHLSETAVNMVIGQIRKATTGDWGQANPAGAKKYAWASQPGVIRNYAVGGSMSKGFKLYSDDKMMEDDEPALVGGDVAELATWSSKPAVFVDLNEPVIRGEKVFYPIVDPRAKTMQDVEGFDYDVSTVGASPLAGAIGKADSQADSLPMPVKWLYQLEDGSMGYMDSGNRFVPIGGASPTTQNPIVGRVAFWTDDETTKLNVNTAAGGMVWDTPRTGGDIDRDFGRYQPTKNEWQRYPGHPATTSLGPVFFPGEAAVKGDSKARRDMMKILYGLTPRIVDGGSLAGTMKAMEVNGLVADRDRLYASLDEYIMRPDRGENVFPVKQMKNGDVAGLLSRSQFFLTASSRAPEVTLFNTPRVNIWPTYYDGVTGSELHRTPFDELIRFTSELGKDQYQYYFQRENADSPTHDYDHIKRNEDVYSYLLKLMDEDVPGFGGSFSSKYPDNHQQILTEIFDYIRSTNLFDDTVYGEGWKDSFTASNGNDHRTYTNYRLDDDGSRGIHMGHGQVTPIEIGNTKGFGRFYTIVEAGILLICNADGTDQISEATGGEDSSSLTDNNDRFFVTKTGGRGRGGCALS